LIVWLASYPRSGNSFARVLLNHVFDVKTYSIYGDRFDIAADEKTARVVGHLALPKGFDFDEARRSPERYFIKTHGRPGPDIHDDDQVVYIVRDGRESSLSYYRYLHDFPKVKVRLEDVILGAAIYGSWAGHVRAWQPDTRPNTVCVRFEDATENPMHFAQIITDFLGIEPVSGHMPSFDELQSINSRFFRSGRKDSWKSVYTHAQHLLFWLKSGDVMESCDYRTEMPAELGGPLGGLSALVREPIEKLEQLELRVREMESDAHRYNRLRPLLERMSQRSRVRLSVSTMLAACSIIRRFRKFGP
jgi:hypothetical protein